MRRWGFVAVTLAVAVLGGCQGRAGQSATATTSACAEPNSAVKQLIAKAGIRAGQAASKWKTPEQQIALGAALQVIVGHPQCFDVATVGVAQQGLAQMNQPDVNFEEDSHGLFGP